MAEDELKLIPKYAEWRMWETRDEHEAREQSERMRRFVSECCLPSSFMQTTDEKKESRLKQYSFNIRNIEKK